MLRKEKTVTSEKQSFGGTLKLTSQALIKWIKLITFQSE